MCVNAFTASDVFLFRNEASFNPKPSLLSNQLLIAQEILHVVLYWSEIYPSVKGVWEQSSVETVWT